MGRYDECLRVLTDANGALKVLTEHDPANVPWQVTMASVEIRRASHALAANDTDQAARQLSAAMDSLHNLESSTATHANREINRVLSRGWLLRARIAWHRGDSGAAMDAAEQSLAEARKGMAKNAVDDTAMADQADALLVLGTLQQAHSPEITPAAWVEARAMLAARSRDSHYWRVLDPWLRLCRLTGDVAHAKVAMERLNASGYVPLQPWPPLATGQPPQ
jgi:hypothetical protein